MVKVLAVRAVVCSSLVAAALAATLAVGHRGNSAPPTPQCKSALTGRTLRLPAGLPGFGRVQGQPPLPLRAHEYVLTIDDGPDPATTPANLASLRAACVRATFFLIGRRARAHPELVRAIVADGHTVGSHSDRHADIGAMTPEEMHRDVLAGAASVEQAAGGGGRRGGGRHLFRIPGGAGSPIVPPPAWMRWFASERLVVAGYDFSPQDWRNDPTAVTLARWRRMRDDRGVIVLHDGQSHTVQLLPLILKDLEMRRARVAALQPSP